MVASDQHQHIGAGSREGGPESLDLGHPLSAKGGLSGPVDVVARR
jgi:hypothetical protein